MIQTAELNHLNGQNVLVKSTRERGNPPIALRGTIDAHTDPEGKPDVRIVLEYPDLCNRAAMQGVIRLTESEIVRLKSSEREGVFEYTTDQPLDPGPDPADSPAVS